VSDFVTISDDGPSSSPGTDTSSEALGGMCLHEVVFAQARLTPDAIAITVGSVSLTYRRLVESAAALARRLAAAGVRAGSMVGVMVDHSVDPVVGFLAVLMAGAAYVPMAADLAARRAQMIVAKAGLQFITGASVPLASAIAANFVPVNGSPVQVPLPGTDPEQAAYVIFTSGSAGRPKGVVVSHRSVVGSTFARFKVYPHQQITYLISSPLTIDAAVAGLYFALFTGGRVVLPTARQVHDPRLLAELLAHEGITHLDQIPSLYAPLLEFHTEAAQGLRCVILGGESLPYPLTRRHLAVAPHVELYNEYGPTEATVWCTAHRCTLNDQGPRVPIGRPISGMRIMVLSDALQPVVCNAVGEIYIGGPGLAQGYLGEPGLTAERFVPDPDHPGERLYRTGDLGHVDANGELVFHGRVDHVVKVRGFRVETEEVESRLREHPGVRDAVVVPHESPTGMRLVAILAIRGNLTLETQALSDFVAELLPAYMIPAVWRQVEALPLTPGGKVDRLALTSGALTIGAALARRRVPPRPRPDNAGLLERKSHARRIPAVAYAPTGWRTPGKRRGANAERRLLLSRR
jgi:amino acid adenylation domain-containing protein